MNIGLIHWWQTAKKFSHLWVVFSQVAYLTICICVQRSMGLFPIDEFLWNIQKSVFHNSFWIRRAFSVRTEIQPKIHFKNITRISLFSLVCMSNSRAKKLLYKITPSSEIPRLSNSVQVASSLWNSLDSSGAILSLETQSITLMDVHPIPWQEEVWFR
jgi:hypothetical protein